MTQLSAPPVPRLLSRHRGRRWSVATLPPAMANGSISMMKQHDENDERNRNSEKPKQNGHRNLSFRG
jgi:hypothetical protein